MTFQMSDTVSNVVLFVVNNIGCCLQNVDLGNLKFMTEQMNLE